MNDDDIYDTKVECNFSFDVDISNQSLTITKDKKTIVLSYWECLLLNRIIEKNTR